MNKMVIRYNLLLDKQLTSTSQFSKVIEIMQFKVLSKYGGILSESYTNVNTFDNVCSNKTIRIWN